MHEKPDGTIEVPDWQRAGWYADGPKPGQPGSAVILGHIDSTSGPAIFYRLSSVARGDEIDVERADGTTAKFAVDRLEQTGKTAFPTADVYLPTLQPGVRLVTCGGTFDNASGHYRDNIIVFAHLT